jgi:hypothetical protein
VTNQQAISWMKDPIPINEIGNSEVFSCKPKQLEHNEITCTYPNNCRLHSRVLQQDRYLKTCNECPPEYPWIRNEFGLD